MVVCVRHTRLTDQHFLCQAVVSEFQEGFSPPGMRSSGYISFAWFSVCRSIKDWGSFCPFCHRIQFIDLIVCAEEEAAMKCLNDKSFCALEITDLQPSGIHQLIVTVPETDAVAGINGTLCQYSQYLADLFMIWLHFEHGSATVSRESEFRVVFLYVGVEKRICFRDC